MYCPRMDLLLQKCVCGGFWAGLGGTSGVGERAVVDSVAGHPADYPSTAFFSMNMFFFSDVARYIWSCRQTHPLPRLLQLGYG